MCVFVGKQLKLQASAIQALLHAMTGAVAAVMVWRTLRAM